MGRDWVLANEATLNIRFKVVSSRLISLLETCFVGAGISS